MNKNLYNFTIKYDGKALQDHSIGAVDLAQALFGLSGALTAINETLNRDEARVNLSIHALKEGSFGIDLSLYQDTFKQIANLFASNPVTGICNASTLVHIFIDLCLLASWLKGRKIEKAETRNDGKVVITVDGQEFITSTEALHVLPNLEVRTSVERFVTPLTHDGIDTLEFVDKGGTLNATFTEEDACNILVEQPEVEITKDVARKVLTIEMASFKRGTKWKVSFGDGAPFFAEIVDEEFLQKVDKGAELFAKHDYLIVDLESKQSLLKGKVVTTHRILKILDHRRQADQLALVIDK